MASPNVAVCLLVGIAGLLASAAAIRYDGYHTVSVGPLKNAQEVEVLQELVDHDDRKQVILMDDVITADHTVTLFCCPERIDLVNKLLDLYSINHETLDTDLQKKFDETDRENRVYRNLYNAGAPSHYMRIGEMMVWMKRVAKAHSIAQIFDIGRTYEGRETYGISINDGRDDLPAVWLDAGIHPREWIAPATAVYIIDRILTGTDPDAQFMRANFRFYILPCVNPDGYEYTHLTDRMWRKTRKPYGRGCYGADANRNFDHNWGRYGTSRDPCSETYGGSSAFSEIETKNIANAILQRKSNMPIMFTLHSFTQLWLMPYGGYNHKPSDYNELRRVANNAVRAVQSVNGKSFRPGTPPDLLYAASGGSFDWAKDSAGIKYAYAPELRPQSMFQGGFSISPSNILPSGREIFAGVAQTCRDVKARL